MGNIRILTTLYSKRLDKNTILSINFRTRKHVGYTGRLEEVSPRGLVLGSTGALISSKAC